MARHALEIPVPVHGDEVRVAPTGAGAEEILHPGPAARGARDRGRADLDAEFLQWLNLCYPARGSEVDGQRGAAGGMCAVGLVEAQHVGDVCAAVELRFDGVVKRCARVAV